MLIKVKVFPDSGKTKVAKKKKDEFEVYVEEKARGNKANKAVCHALSSYFGAPMRRVMIIKGGKRRNKIIRVQKTGVEGKK